MWCTAVQPSMSLSAVRIWALIGSSGQQQRSIMARSSSQSAGLPRSGRVSQLKGPHSYAVTPPRPRPGARARQRCRNVASFREPTKRAGVWLASGEALPGRVSCGRSANVGEQLVQ